MPIERKRYEWPRFANKRDWPAYGVRNEWPALAPIPEPEFEEVIRFNQVIITIPPPEAEDSSLFNLASVAVFSEAGIGVEMSVESGNTPASGLYPAANRALYFPLTLHQEITARKLYCVNGGTANGNLDLGIYSKAGVRLVSTGSTAQAGTNVLQIIDITDTVLEPGQYYLAISADATTLTFQRDTVLVANTLTIIGVREEASAFPLPASATFADVTGLYVPYIGTVGLATDPA